MRFLLILGTAAFALAQPQAEPAKPAPSAAIQQRVQPPARIISFTATPATAKPGDKVMLQWSVENPSSTSIDPDIGRVTPRGSKQIEVQQTTTFTLAVTGPANSKLSKDVTITVPGTQARTAASAPKKTEIARLNGKPDFSGVYGAAAGGGRGGAAAGAPPPPELKPGAEKFKVTRGPNDSGLYADCMPTGVPQAYSVPYQWQIVQGADKVVIMYEYPHLFRVIPTSGIPHQADLDPTWMGDSVGHWEGDTLVVDITAFNDKTELPGGFRHTESLHVIERFTRTADGIQYEATIEDPNVFVRPWKMVRTFQQRTDLEKVDEFVCENNHDYSKLFKQ